MSDPPIQPLLPMRRALMIALGSLFVVGTAGWALSPWLLVEAPLLLLAMNPLPRHVLMVAPSVDFLPLLLVVVVRREMACVVAYFVGETYGQRALLFAQRRRPRLWRWGQRLADLFGKASVPLLILAPNLTALLAGTSRMRFAWFLPASLLGQLWLATATYYLGDSLRDYIAPVLAFVREHTATLTIGMVAVVALRQWLRYRRRLALGVDRQSESEVPEVDVSSVAADDPGPAPTTEDSRSAVTSTSCTADERPADGTDGRTHPGSS